MLWRPNQAAIKGKQRGICQRNNSAEIKRGRGLGKAVVCLPHVDGSTNEINALTCPRARLLKQK